MPKSYDGSKPFPVVLALHGGGSNAEQMVRFCGLNELADRAGFLVVYPNGTGAPGTANYASPMIVSVPKDKVKKVSFIENGKTAGTAEAK